MKIALLSDFHLGFVQAGRENEAFENAMQAMQLALEKGAELVIISGDIFDKEVPNAETLLQAFTIFSLARNANEKSTHIKKVARDQSKTISLKGVPIIAIHGTHEFRARDYVNYLQLFESAGFIVYLHAAKAIIESQNERIVVHGLGGVPEKKALDALKLWDPKPEQNAFNILVLHQSLKEFLPFDDEMIATLSIDALPEGFDIIVDGHLHWQNELVEGNKRLILPGSTIITQMKRLEAKKPKGFYIIETKTKELKFCALPNRRPFFYEKIEFENASIEEVLRALKERLSQLVEKSHAKKPLIKIKLLGSLAKGHSQENIDIKSTIKEFEDRALISVDSNFFQESFTKKLAALSDLQKQRKSIIELGFDILEKNLAETDFNNAFDVRRVFKLLENNDVEKARELLIAAQESAEKIKKQF
jgi:DNA repair exonuclease SbcCD nuclease subunit